MYGIAEPIKIKKNKKARGVETINTKTRRALTHTHTSKGTIRDKPPHAHTRAALFTPLLYKHIKIYKNLFASHRNSLIKISDFNVIGGVIAPTISKRVKKIKIKQKDK